MRICKNCKNKINDNWVVKCPKCSKAVSLQGKQALYVWCGILLFSGAVLFGIAHGGSSDQTVQDAAKTSTPTPNPAANPCREYLGSSAMVDCMKMQNAMDKANALSHPLHATVTYNNFALSITNTENQEWDQCTATLDDTDPSADNYQSNGFVAGAGQTVTIQWADMANNESQRFDYSQTKPYSLDLDCMVGGQVDKKTGAFSGGQEHRSRFNL